MTLSDARARNPELNFASADVSADARLLARLAQVCERYTPSLALEPPDGLTLNVTGCAHLFGGEAALSSKVNERLRDLGLTVRTCLAATPQAAHMLVRHTEIAIVPPGAQEALVRRLPIAALGLAPDLIRAISRTGLRKIGELLDRPSCLFSARYGADFSCYLARLLGKEDIGILSLRPAPEYSACFQFSEPLKDVNEIFCAIELTLTEAIAPLAELGYGGRIFEAAFFHHDGTKCRVAIETGRATRDIRTIMLLFREQVAACISPESSFGYDCIRVEVYRIEVLSSKQIRFDGKGDHLQIISNLIAVLTSRLGQHQVARFFLMDVHSPDRKARRFPAMESQASAGIFCDPKGTDDPPARPVRVFEPPQQVYVMAAVPDGPPILVRWENASFKVHKAAGPERIAPEWWRDDSSETTQDYYRIEDARGRRYWIFRRGVYGSQDKNPSWFVYGMFG
jgi:protein ImuB